MADPEPGNAQQIIDCKQRMQSEQYNYPNLKGVIDQCHITSTADLLKLLPEDVLESAVLAYKSGSPAGKEGLITEEFPRVILQGGQPDWLTLAFTSDPNHSQSKNIEILDFKSNEAKYFSHEITLADSPSKKAVHHENSKSCTQCHETDLKAIIPAENENFAIPGFYGNQNATEAEKAAFAKLQKGAKNNPILAEIPFLKLNPPGTHEGIGGELTEPLTIRNRDRSYRVFSKASWNNDKRKYKALYDLLKCDSKSSDPNDGEETYFKENFPELKSLFTQEELIQDVLSFPREIALELLEKDKRFYRLVSSGSDPSKPIMSEPFMLANELRDEMGSGKSNGSVIPAAKKDSICKYLNKAKGRSASAPKDKACNTKEKEPLHRLVSKIKKAAATPPQECLRCHVGEKASAPLIPFDDEKKMIEYLADPDAKKRILDRVHSSGEERMPPGLEDPTIRSQIQAHIRVYLDELSRKSGDTKSNSAQ